MVRVGRSSSPKPCSEEGCLQPEKVDQTLVQSDPQSF